jgi:hypothetical protein
LIYALTDSRVEALAAALAREAGRDWALLEESVPIWENPEGGRLLWRIIAATWLQRAQARSQPDIVWGASPQTDV